MEHVPAKYIQYMFDEVAESIKRYQKFDDTTRFLMLADKLHMMTTSVTIGLIGMVTDDFSKDDMTEEKKQILDTTLDHITNISKIVKDELFDLEDFIRDKRDNPLKAIESKLDEVLLGPDYPAGRQMMEDAKKDFQSRI